MKDEIREQLSALVDDELTDMEQPLLVGRLQRDAQLRACMGRYQLIGDVIRGGVTQATGLGIASRVQDALANDLGQTSLPAEPVMSTQPGRSFWKPVAGLAVAASVALVAVLSIQGLQSTQPETPQLAVNVETQPEAVQASVVQVTTHDSQWDRIEPRVEKRLNGYLVNHSEFASSHGMQGLTPYVRIVGFEDAQ